MDHLIRDDRAPEDPDLLRQLSTGLSDLSGFITAQYLQDFIPQGGSKIKFITGRCGSGKTQLANFLSVSAREEKYLVARLSAERIWLHDFREIYLEVLRQCSIDKVLHACAERIVSGMGYDPAKISEGAAFMDYLSEIGEADAISKSAIRTALREMFIRNPMLDNSFAFCCSLLTGGILGYPVLEDQNRELLLSYLTGDRSVKLAALRALGLSPSRITKYNARHLLRSLSEIVHLGGFSGILVVIDDMEVLRSRAAAEPVHYSKLRREDAYESLRQLIDDIDSMRYIMFLLCFDRALIDDESYGIKSYQALWMRIQNEVVSTRFNRFADIIDMDRYADTFYTVPVLMEMAEKRAAYLSDQGEKVHPLTEEDAEKLYQKAQYGNLGLPGLLCAALRDKGGTEHA